MSGFRGCEGFGFGGAVVGLFAAAAETVLWHSGGGHGVVVGAGWPAWRRGLCTGGGGMGGASLVKELLVVRVYSMHVEFEVGMSVWEGIEAVGIVVVEALSVVEMYISLSRHTRNSRVQRVWAL